MAKSALCLPPETSAIANRRIWASKLKTADAVIDAVAVTYVPLTSSAETPQRCLDEPREGGGKVRVVGSGVHAAGEALDQITTPPGRSAASTERVLSLKARQGAGSVQEVMDQRVDGDHPGTGGDPALAVWVGTERRSARIIAQSLGPIPWISQSGWRTAARSKSPRSG